MWEVDQLIERLYGPPIDHLLTLPLISIVVFINPVFIIGELPAQSIFSNLGNHSGARNKFTALYHKQWETLLALPYYLLSHWYNVLLLCHHYKCVSLPIFMMTHAFNYFIMVYSVPYQRHYFLSFNLGNKSRFFHYSQTMENINGFREKFKQSRGYEGARV